MIEKLFNYPATFIKTVVKTLDLPSSSLPEIAFAGRSNVGKSSLINALFNRRQLARASNTPGRTQALNYFRVEDFLHFVDMPGYGYAKASHSQIEQWLPLMQDYITHRPQLLRIYVLVDARHGLKTNDLEFLLYLDTIALSYQIVLTKTDKIKKVELSFLQENLTHEFANHPAMYPSIISTSSSKKTGLDDLKQSIIDLIKSNTIDK